MQPKPEQSPLLRTALAYHRLGWSIIRVPYGTKKARSKWKKYQAVRPSDEQLGKWFSNGKRSNIAVVCGEVSGGLACRDFDDMAEYESWVAEYPDLARLLPVVQTARGRHVYFQSDLAKIKHIENGELRGAGYCLLPPSVHPDGPTYKWIIRPKTENLIYLDPKTTGFTANVTEQAEHTEQTEQTEAMVLGGCESVEKAIDLTLPSEFGTRNRKVFEFVRALKSLPAYADAKPADLRELVQQWHRQALPHIQTKKFEETWIDFLKAWGNVEYPMGKGPIAMTMQKVIQLDPPKVALQKYPKHQKVQVLVSLCRELQRAAGEHPFFLSCRTTGTLFGVEPMTASRWLFMLEADGILKTVDKGRTGKGARKATRFRYIEKC